MNDCEYIYINIYIYIYEHQQHVLPFHVYAMCVAKYQVYINIRVQCITW